MEKIIETVNLTKNFGKFTAVSDVCLSVNRGEIYGFLGLNGAGKTTTIRMLLGLIRPTNGYALICGEKIKPGGVGPWKQIGSLVEVPYSYPELTVRENLEVIRCMRRISDKNVINNVLEKLKLSQYSKKKAGQLSLGNSQRLGLAKALIHNPDVLILDEPSNGLDPAGIVEIRQLLLDLAKNHLVTIFISSHILDEVSRLASRIGIIHEGKLMQEMDSAEINSLRQRRLIVGTDDNHRTRKILEKEGLSIFRENRECLELISKNTIEHPEKIATILVNEGNPPSMLYVKEENLESMFMRIIGMQGKSDD